MSSFDRERKEPPTAWLGFTIYRDLGPERSLAQVAAIRGVGLSTIEAMSSRWNWPGRADQFDGYVESVRRRAFLTETAKRAQQRAQAYDALLLKCLLALKQVNVEEVPLPQIAAAMKIATEGQRLEEHLATARVRVEVTDARTVLASLPRDVRAGLLRVLARNAGAGGDTEPPGGIPGGLGPD